MASGRGLIYDRFIDDRAKRIDLYNQQMAQVVTASKPLLDDLARRANNARAAGNTGQANALMDQYNTILAGQQTEAGDIELEARKYIHESENDLLMLRLSLAATQFAQLGDATELTAAWSGRTGTPTEIAAVGDGTYQIGFIDKNNEPQWRGGDANPKRYSKAEIITQYWDAVAPAWAMSAAAKKGQCSPSYVGACVPIAADVDCLGGTGDGPAYPNIDGPFAVVGADTYDLDRDKDGAACEDSDRQLGS